MSPLGSACGSSQGPRAAPVKQTSSWLGSVVQDCVIGCVLGTAQSVHVRFLLCPGHPAGARSLLTLTPMGCLPTVQGCRKFNIFTVFRTMLLSMLCGVAHPSIARPPAVRAWWSPSWDRRLCMRITGMGMCVGTPPSTPSRAGGPSPLRLVLAN